MLLHCAAVFAVVNIVILLIHAQGSSIQQLVMSSAFFQQARSIGLYVTCDRLREVDTMAVLQATLQQGVLSTAALQQLHRKAASSCFCSRFRWTSITLTTQAALAAFRDPDAAAAAVLSGDG